MNLQQFAALKPGDKVENVFSNSVGEVTEATASGVKVRWGGSGYEFAYTVSMTAWMHWDKVPEERRTQCPECGSNSPPTHAPTCSRAAGSS